MAQLINIYGFPPSKFFSKWLPIYGTFLVLLITPAIIVGISKLVRKDQEKVEIKEDNIDE